MKQANSWAVFIFALIPYMLVVWLFTRLNDGDSEMFWCAFAVLIGLRVFFAIIEGLGGMFQWRLYGRQIAVSNALEFLKANKFPKREYEHDDFLTYLYRIKTDLEYPESIRRTAGEVERMLIMWEQFGILIGARLHSAWDTAYEMYTPKAQATKHL